MKLVKKAIVFFLSTIFLIVTLAYLFNVEYLLKAIRTVYFTGHTTAYLDDYKKFDNAIIAKSNLAQPWPIHSKYNKVIISSKLAETHKKLGTVAFLIIKNDSIWHESYYDGYKVSSKSNSFSMAKSIVSMALGKAIYEGKIKSLDQKVAYFYPQFNKGYAAQMTVGDLSSMASGLNWDENYYSPFSITTRAYFDDDLKSLILQLKGIETPGKQFKYLSGNSQLLAMVIEKATGKKLENYVSESFWKPMGAEHEALWQTDNKDGIIKAFCCVASNARDFARFGKLFNHYGKWNHQQIIDSAFVAKSITPRFKTAPQYGYGWWLSTFRGKKVAYMRGHLGQNVIIIPEDHIIIVRLGHHEGDNAPNSPHKQSFFTFIEETYNMLKI